MAEQEEPALIAGAPEPAPFHKALFSTGFPPARSGCPSCTAWARCRSAAAGRTGDWSRQDAGRVAMLIGSGNAARVYGLEGT